MPTFDGRAYQAKFDGLAAQGLDVHGEATFVRSLQPGSVLDAGCGTGRVAIELARHAIDVVGVDVDPSMLAEARHRAPHLTWVEADLATLDLGRTFDVVLLAGNVPLFCPPGKRRSLVVACASHLRPGGTLVAGFQLDDRYDLGQWDSACRAAGLALLSRRAAWDGAPFVEDGAYAVSLHRQDAPIPRPSPGDRAAS